MAIVLASAITILALSATQKDTIIKAGQTSTHARIMLSILYAVYVLWLCYAFLLNVAWFNKKIVHEEDEKENLIDAKSMIQAPIGRRVGAYHKML